MQRENLHLQIDRQIIGDTFTSRAPMDNLEVLCDDLGARFAGTPQERQAAEFIATTCKKYGLENIRLEAYPYAGWSRGEARLEILEPSGRVLPCISLPYCPAADISAELLFAGYGSPDEYAALAGKMQGRLVLAGSASPPDLGRWVHRKEKYERAVLGGAAGFVFVSEHPGVGPETGSLQNDRPGPIPGISISKEDGEFLQRLSRRKGPLKLRLHTSDINEKRESWNVVAELPGSSAAAEMVILGCHYDGHDISQGAVDPASGMVLVMEAARVLALYAAAHLECTVRFVAFGTEEIGLVGAHRYVEAHADELDRVRFMYNLDSAGGPSRKGVVLHCWPELESFFTQAAREMVAEVPVGQKVHPHSDHFPFFLKGVPSGHMSDPEAGPKGRGFGHTAYDTLDKVELENLRRGSATAARLVLRLANAPDFPARRRSCEAVRAILDTDPDMEAYRVAQALAQQGARSDR